MIPKKLTCLTDGSELEFTRVITKVTESKSGAKKTEISYEYRFIKSETKKGMLMTLSDEQLKTNIKKGIFL